MIARWRCGTDPPHPVMTAKTGRKRCQAGSRTRSPGLARTPASRPLSSPRWEGEWENTGDQDKLTCGSGRGPTTRNSGWLGSECLRSCRSPSFPRQEVGRERNRHRSRSFLFRLVHRPRDGHGPPLLRGMGTATVADSTWRQPDIPRRSLPRWMGSLRQL